MAHEHSHENALGENRRALAITLALAASFTVAEVIGGLLTGSLALLADAGHMLSDNLSLGVALFAAWLAGRPKTPEKSFGYKRVEILAALANGDAGGGLDLDLRGGPLAPAGAAGDPRHPMLAIAGVGLLVNVAGAIVLSRSVGESLNMQGALRHGFPATARPANPAGACAAAR